MEMSIMPKSYRGLDILSVMYLPWGAAHGPSTSIFYEIPSAPPWIVLST